jgi:hypothetical protein
MVGLPGVCSFAYMHSVLPGCVDEISLNRRSAFVKGTEDHEISVIK